MLSISEMISWDHKYNNKPSVRIRWNILGSSYYLNPVLTSFATILIYYAPHESQLIIQCIKSKKLQDLSYILSSWTTFPDFVCQKNNRKKNSVVEMSQRHAMSDSLTDLWKHTGDIIRCVFCLVSWIHITWVLGI